MLIRYFLLSGLPPTANECVSGSVKTGKSLHSAFILIPFHIHYFFRCVRCVAMVRNRVRKTTSSTTSAEVMEAAARAVVSREKSLSEAALT